MDVSEHTENFVLKRKKKRKSHRKRGKIRRAEEEVNLPPFSLTPLWHIRAPEFPHSPLPRTPATRVVEYLTRTSNLSGRLKQYCLLC